MRHQHPLKSIAAVCLLVAAALAACSEDGAAPGDVQQARGQAAVAVIAQPVTFQTELRRIEAIGTARARLTAVLFPAVGGEVTSVLFKAGDFVSTNTPLLTLDARDETLNVDFAGVAVAEARQLLERYRRIEDTGAISDSQIDEAETALKGAQINLKRAQVDLDDRTVKAPFDGFLGLTEIDPGARITPSTAIARLDDRRILYVDFSAPEEVFTSLTFGDIVSASPFADTDIVLDAKIISVDSRVEQARRTFTARAEIDNQADRFRPGMSFRVMFEIPGRKFPTVPEAALVWGSDGAYLWAIEDGLARRTPVTIVARSDGDVLVDADLAPGSQVIAEGVQKARDGQPVRILRVNPVDGDVKVSQAEKVAR